MVRKMKAQEAGNVGPPVSAVYDVAVISEPSHQLVEEKGDGERFHRFLGAAREIVSRIGRNSYAECVFGTTSMSLGMSELIDDAIVGVERVGPTMRNEKRDRVWPRPSFMNEVNVNLIDTSDELR